MFFRQQNNSQHPVFITDEGNIITNEDFLRFYDSVSGYLRIRSVVFCLCGNDPGCLMGYLSFITNKVVPVMLDKAIDVMLLKRLVTLYKPRYIWLPHDHQDVFDAKPVYSDHGYSLCEFLNHEIYELNEDLALLLTTSGSTGSSRFVRISYENLLANAASISDYLSINEDERPVTTLPVCYSYGLSVINSHIMKGATILLSPASIIERSFWEFIKKERATSISGVPYTYHILDRLNFTSMDIPSLKTYTQAGGRINEAIARKTALYCRNTDRKFYVMYGQTEATARMSYFLLSSWPEKTDTIGKAIPGGTFSLVDPDGKEIVESYTTGELVYKGKNVSQGYAGCPEDLAGKDDNKGMLFTGDLAMRDNDGDYYLKGRKNRYVKIFGNRISLDETERLAEDVCTDCACTGTDEKITIHLSSKSDAIDLPGYLAKKTGINPSAFTVKVHNCLPRNTSGKIDYSKLTEWTYLP